MGVGRVVRQDGFHCHEKLGQSVHAEQQVSEIDRETCFLGSEFHRSTVHFKCGGGVLYTEQGNPPTVVCARIGRIECHRPIQKINCLPVFTQIGIDDTE